MKNCKFPRISHSIAGEVWVDKYRESWQIATMVLFHLGNLAFHLFLEKGWMQELTKFNQFRNALIDKRLIILYFHSLGQFVLLFAVVKFQSCNNRSYRNTINDTDIIRQIFCHLASTRLLSLGMTKLYNHWEMLTGLSYRRAGPRELGKHNSPLKLAYPHTPTLELCSIVYPPGKPTRLPPITLFLS